jgi:hypothetical protein
MMTTRPTLRPEAPDASASESRNGGALPSSAHTLVGPEWDRMRQRIAELKQKGAGALSGLNGSGSEFETDDPLIARAVRGDFARESIREKYGPEVLKRLEELCGE